MLTAVMIDSREPQWVQQLSFGGLPTSVALLDYGDVWATDDAGNMLAIERKSEDDLLGTLAADRLFPQMVGLRGLSTWAYLVVCGPLRCDHDGHVITARGVTGWGFGAVWGALLSVQELGVQVVFCANELDFEPCVLRLGNRNRAGVMPVAPAKQAHFFSDAETILASLPGIGMERAQSLLATFGDAASALEYLCDLSRNGEQRTGIGPVTKRNVRKALGLGDWCSLAVVGSKEPQEETK